MAGKLYSFTVITPLFPAGEPCTRLTGREVRPA
jgi:hypothetical protein